MRVLGSFIGCFFLFLAILVSTSPVFARPNFNIDSLFFWTISGTRGGWGFVDSAGNEYALICAGDRLEIFDVTNPSRPDRLNPVPALPGAADLKQVRPYKQYVVAVNQRGGIQRAALQVIDMRDPVFARTAAVWPDTGNTLPNGAHTIHIEGDSAYLGMNGADDEWYVVDIHDPLKPAFRTSYMTSAPRCGGFSVQSHDSYVKNDTAYIAFLGGGFSIAARTADKPVVFQSIADVCYPEAVTHNCWLTEDHKYLFTTDERPEGRLRVWDLRDPVNPVQVAEWAPPGISSIIHNVQVKGNFLYASYYADGAVILDIEDPTQPVEVGHYDTAPQAGPSGNFYGCWDFFPYFPSGALLASNLSSPPGMWLLHFNETKAGKLRGTVTNWETGEPLPDATVRFVGVPRQTRTDSFGNYAIRTEGGIVRLEFSLPNFRPETLTVGAVFNDTTVVDTVPLVPVSLLPSTPQGLTARSIDGGNIQLFWQKPPDAGLVGFRLYRTLLSDTTAFALLDSLSPAETSYTDAGSVAGERYFYRVTAVNSLFESFVSNPVKAMRFVFGPKLLLVNRTGPSSISSYRFFRDTIQSFYRRALRRYDFDTLDLRDEAFSLPNAIPPNFVTGNRVIYVHSAELRTGLNDNPTFLSYFSDFIKAGGKLVMDGHWALGGVNTPSFLKCLPADAPFSTSADVWETLQTLFGFDCVFFPRVYPIDTGLVNRSFLTAEPHQPGYPLLVADSGRAADGVKAFISPGIEYGYPTVPIIGYLNGVNPSEDVYRFGSIVPATDPKQGLPVAKKYLDPSTGGGFVWFNFPLFYMREDSAKKAIRRALADLGVPEDFPKGDLNRDGLSDPADVVYLLNYVFLDLPFPGFDPAEADFNCSGTVSPADVMFFLRNIFPPNLFYPCD